MIKQFRHRFYLWLVAWGLIFFISGCEPVTPTQPLAATLTPAPAATPTLSAAVLPDALTTQSDPSIRGPDGSDEEDPQAEADTPPPTAIPLPDLPPEKVLPAAARAFELGDYQQSADLFGLVIAKGDDGFTAAQTEGALLGLGQAQLALNQRVSALETFDIYLATAAEPDSRVYFWLAEAEPNPQKAAAHYQTYLAANPDMVAYVEPRIAELLPAEAEAHLVAALEGDAYYLVFVDVRLELAEQYVAAGRYAEAIEQFSAVRDVARTVTTRGEMTYRIGQTYELAGDEGNALTAYAVGVENYPASYATYQGLVALVEAGRPVDDYQRGTIDYYAKVYGPAVEALRSYIQENEVYRPDAHLFLAWSYEGLGEPTNALAELDRYLAIDRQNPEFIATYIEEKEALLTRSVSTSQAIDALQTFAQAFPDHPLVPWALYRSGVLADRFRQDSEQAIPLYERFVTTFPEHLQASEALFRVGMMHFEADRVPEAQAKWQQTAAYGDEFGRAALVWLIRTTPPAEAETFRAQAAAVQGADYYALRARDIGQELLPYSPIDAFKLEFDETAAQAEVEAWIASQFNLPSDAPVTSTLDPAIATDPRLIRGEKLWHLGLKSAAKQELEAIRQQYAENAQLSYQLALYFRDLGLYRSSILSAAAVLNRANASPFDAPSLIGRLAYPVYYSDLVMPLAKRYGYDPLLQFAQIRQESLFESFIASSAAARGLTQIIPDTGQYIANQLNWPGYELNDLNRPAINLPFGAYYLDQQLALFDGTIAPALAAYNAGPGNALGWYNTAGDDHDLYLETVNFAETRLYIQRIYTGQAVYKHLYGEGE